MKIFWMILLSVCASSPIFAGDTAQFEFLGFSPDGRYAAFEMEGVQDGSGFPYAEFYVLNVEKNDYAQKPVLKRWPAQEEEGGLTLPEVKREWNKIKAPVMRKWNVQTRVQGDRVSLEPLQAGQWRFAHQGRMYELFLAALVVEKNCYEMGLNAEILDLRIRREKKETVLQKDSRLPKSRGCASGYEISHVFVFQGFVAVAVSFRRPGFEGPDGRWMMITGRLP